MALFQAYRLRKRSWYSISYQSVHDLMAKSEAQLSGDAPCDCPRAEERRGF